MPNIHPVTSQSSFVSLGSSFVPSICAATGQCASKYAPSTWSENPTALTPAARTRNVRGGEVTREDDKERWGWTLVELQRVQGRRPG